MPNIKSAKKRVKVIAKKTAINKSYNSSLKTCVKKANAAISESSDNKQDLFRLAVKSIDRAVSKGILHKNTAARKKSSLAKKMNVAG